MKNVLITGASGGIGQALARAFARAGYGVGLHYHHGEAAAQRLAKELSTVYGVSAVPVGADLRRTADVQAMVETAQRELGFIGTLVNNAGVAQQKLFTDITDEEWDDMIGIHLSGTFRCCRAVLPEMIRRREGTIVTVSSMWGQIGGSCEVHYSAAKAGIIGLTKALAKEVGLSGITVNCIAPGVIRTAMLDAFSEEDLAALAEETPVGRIGTPEDVADTAVFLAGDGARFITGQVIGVNGGFVV
ncbi:MAG: 3-oxoacyl-ACP reductase FabG [Clostridia bacterium]|nr:3-oxoacyl-ACP reductase FabG [Clostridia bacterium]